jgi:alanine racemase
VAEGRGDYPLEELLSCLPRDSYQITGNTDIKISSINWDYQKVTKNSLYFCLQFEEFQEVHIQNNSLDHWKMAFEAGAICLVVEEGVQQEFPPQITVIHVTNLNRCHALMAKAFYQDPFSTMQTIGITGTNGKTTTSQLIDSILLHANRVSGIIGTIGIFYPSKKTKAGCLSNPLASELFSIGAGMKRDEVETVVMEITSHGMEFDRTYSMDFDIAVFTNLTQDHLDYHLTFEAYKKAKIKHFSRLGTERKKSYAIVNIDDAHGGDFIDAIDKALIKNGKVSVLTYGIRNKNADLVAYPKQMTGSHSEFDLFLRGDYLCSVELPMPGLFNIYNAIAAFGSSFALGVKIEQIITGLSKAKQVEGRFEQVNFNSDFDIYIDYAHTPDSLHKILEEVKKLTKRKVINLFGCGGDRDRSKRPKMGRISAELADISIVTSDNPRSEDQEQIIQDILADIREKERRYFLIEPDRRKAIYLALKLASSGDSVLIAGKGHETYQLIGDKKYNFSDRAVVCDFFNSEKTKFQRAWINIDTGIIAKNLALIGQDKPQNLKLLIVVKDNALGHGMIEVAKIAKKNGCEYLGVAFVSEAFKLKQAYLDLPILVFGEPPDNQLSSCIQQKITLQVQSVEKAKKIGKIAQKLNKTAKIHFKVDTGMGRYGLKTDQAVAAFFEITKIPGIEIEGLMTHFAQSDELDKSYANSQWEKFQSVINLLKDKKLLPKIVHCCNTGGYLDLPHAHCDMVRLGTLPLGVYPSAVCRRIQIDEEELMPAMSVGCRVAYLKDLETGDSIGYGMHYKAEKKARVAILPIGYGDGYPRLRNIGHVLIKGEIAKIIGGNGMDATMVDISSIGGVKVGDKVVLLGRQGAHEITARMLAKWAKTVTYQILALWTERMERNYL